MKSKKLYISMSIFIVVMVGGGTVFSFYFEDIQIRYYIWKLDTNNEAEQKKAFEWLYEKAEEDIEDKRLKAFFKHPESKRQVELEDEWGDPISLFSATENGEFVNIKILLDQGTDVNTKNNSGFTPMHFAAGLGKVEIAKKFIKHGANVNAKANNGMTSLDLVFYPPTKGDYYYLKEEKKQVMQSLLRNHGAMTGAELKLIQGKKKQGKKKK